MFLLFPKNNNTKSTKPFVFIAQIAFRNKENQPELNQVQQLKSIIYKTKSMSSTILL